MKARIILFIITVAAIYGTSLGQDLPSEGSPKGYLIGPGDEVTGRVLGEKDFDFVATVDEDGRIEIPFFDSRVGAKCRTALELQADVAALYAKYLRDPQFSLRVTKRRSLPVIVYGEAVNPGKIDEIIRGKATLVEVLAFFGGVKDEAGGLVQVFRPQAPPCAASTDDSNWKADTSDPTDIPSRMFQLASLKSGDVNPMIYPGDVIFVHKAQPLYVTGEVQAPQGMYLKEGGMTLTEAIAKVGGVNRQAKTKEIKIYRLKTGTKEREVIAANYDLIKKGEQNDVPLQAMDIIEVGRAKDSLAMSILKIALGAGRAGITSAAQGTGLRVLY